MLPDGEFERQEVMEVPHSERMLGFFRELHTQSDPRSTGDERIAAFAVAANQSMHENPNFRRIIEVLLDERPQIDPSYAVNLVLRAVQKQLARDTDLSNYPDRFTEPEPWAEALEVMSDPSNYEDYDDFVADISYRNVQSNVAERYKSISLLRHLMSRRLDTNPNILDIGCSQNQGLKKLALAPEMPFGGFSATNEQHSDRSTLETQILNRLLATPVNLGPSVGVDIMHPNDVGNKEWARSCSFYPSELLNDHRREEYDLLEVSAPPQVGFYGADFSEFDHEDFAAHSPVQKFDMVTFSTVLYQVREHEREVMLENARRLLKPLGLIVVQDFITVNPEDETELVFHPNWFEYNYLYTTVVIDPIDPSGRIHEVFRWENGRCRRLQTGRDIGRISLFVK